MSVSLSSLLIVVYLPLFAWTYVILFSSSPLFAILLPSTAQLSSLTSTPARHDGLEAADLPSSSTRQPLARFEAPQLEKRDNLVSTFHVYTVQKKPDWG